MIYWFMMCDLSMQLAKNLCFSRQYRYITNHLCLSLLATTFLPAQSPLHSLTRVLLFVHAIISSNTTVTPISIYGQIC